MAFTTGSKLTNKVAASAAVFGTAVQATNTVAKLGTALANVGNAASVGSAIRSLNLPAAGEAIGDLVGAVAAFSSSDNGADWRVRLSLPLWTSFQTSPALKPLRDAGGLVFPYTPRISMKSAAAYSPESVTHTNFPFHAFKNSAPGNIEINATMAVEDSTQALYWIAMVHYLRSVTKMFSGYDPKAGNPPPIVHLNAYGNYVFRNVPCVVTQFSCTLPADVDYLAVEVFGSAMADISGVADSIGGLADTLGGAIPGVSALNTISSIAGGVGQVASLLGSFGVGGKSSGGTTHVPTKSEFNITLMPMYSRASSRKFSLDRFVSGGYLKSPFGYV